MVPVRPRDLVEQVGDALPVADRAVPGRRDASGPRPLLPVQADRPQTLAHALTDSPVGLLGWNGQDMIGFLADIDVLLTHVSLYWLTGTGGSALRIYAEHTRQEPPAEPTTVPSG